MASRHLALDCALVMLLTLAAPAVAAAQARSDDSLVAGYRLLQDGDKAGAEQYFLAQFKNRGDLGSRFGVLAVQHLRLIDDDALAAPFERSLDELIDIANKRHNSNPRDAEALFYCAFGHMLRGTYKFENDKGLLGAARDGAHAKDDIEKYLKMYPDDGDAYLALGTYNYFASLAPAYAHIMRMLLFLPSGNRAEGLKEIERTAAQGRLFNVQAQSMLIDIYTFEGRPAEAVAAGEQLLRQHPANDDAELSLADVYDGPAIEDRPKAAAAYERVIARRESDSSLDGAGDRDRALLGLAATRFEMWRCDDAIATLTPAIDRHAREPAWALPQFLILRSNYRLHLNDPHGADDARRVIADPAMTKWHKSASDLLTAMGRRSPAELAMYVSLIPANRLVADGKWDAARQAYAAVAAHAPGDLQVQYRIAYLDFASGAPDRARVTFTALANNGAAPAWVRAWSLLYKGRADDLSGRRDAARKDYQSVLDDYEKQDAAADAARLGLITPYHR